MQALPRQREPGGLTRRRRSLADRLKDRRQDGGGDAGRMGGARNWCVEADPTNDYVK